MPIIYEPRGKAREYSPLAANLYRGCSHGCVYCYAPSATFTDRAKFAKPYRRKNVIEQIEKEAPQYRNDPRPILLCFTCDPYQPKEDVFNITRQGLKIFTENKCTVQVLTKGGTRACRDFDLLSQNPLNSFGTTLTFDNPTQSIEWEPKAALPDDRIEALKIAHEAGIKTWVSFEPVIEPEQVYRLIKKTHAFVDLYKVGKLNYHPRAKEIDWRTFRIKAESILNSLQKDYYIKIDLQKF